MQTIQPISKLRRQPQRPARHAGGIQRQGKISPDAPRTDGFLTHRFLPLCEVKNKVPEKERAEADYFMSLAELCSIHNLQPMEIAHFPYPQGKCASVQ